MTNYLFVDRLADARQFFALQWEYVNVTKNNVITLF